MSISLPGLARFGCDVSATVGGIPNFRIGGARCHTPGHFFLLGINWSSGAGSIYQSIHGLRADSVRSTVTSLARAYKENLPCSVRGLVGHDFNASHCCRFATVVTASAFDRRRWRRRTPGPPPSSSMNSTPAASNARRTAKSLAAVIDVSSSVSSARRMVVTPRADARARS